MCLVFDSFDLFSSFWSLYMKCMSCLGPCWREGCWPARTRHPPPLPSPLYSLELSTFAFLRTEFPFLSTEMPGKFIIADIIINIIVNVASVTTPRLFISLIWSRGRRRRRRWKTWRSCGWNFISSFDQIPASGKSIPWIHQDDQPGRSVPWDQLKKIHNHPQLPNQSKSCNPTHILTCSLNFFEPSQSGEDVIYTNTTGFSISYFFICRKTAPVVQTLLSRK